MRFMALLGVFSLYANDMVGQYTLQHAYGGTEEETCSKVLVSGTGFVLTGHTTTFGTGSYDFLILKTDSNGEPLWSKTYGGFSTDISLGSDKTSDGGFILIGYSNSFGAGSNDILVVKTDSLGIVEWSKAYGSNYGDWGYDVQQTIDGGYILTGYLDVSQPVPGPWLADIDLVLIKLDSIGNVDWSSAYGDSLQQMGREVIQTNDQGYLVAGHSNASIGGLANVFLVKTDDLGVPIWSKTYGAFYSEYGYAVGEIDGGYIVATLAYTDTYNSGNSADIVVFRTDSTGTLLWSNVYGQSGYDDAWDLIVNNDNTITIAGSTNNWSNGETDFLLMKIDGNGDLIWSNSFGGSSFDNGYTMAAGNNGSYVIAGATKTYGFGLFDMFFAKTDAAGNGGCNDNAFAIDYTSFSITENTLSDYDPVSVISTDVNIITSSPGILHDSICVLKVAVPELTADLSIHVYPNPFSQQTTIEFENTAHEIHTLTLYDIHGRIVKRRTEINGEKLILKRGNLSSGMYFFQLRTNTQIRATGKLIVE